MHGIGMRPTLVEFSFWVQAVLVGGVPLFTAECDIDQLNQSVGWSWSIGCSRRTSWVSKAWSTK